MAVAAMEFWQDDFLVEDIVDAIRVQPSDRTALTATQPQPPVRPVAKPVPSRPIARTAKAQGKGVTPPVSVCRPIAKPNRKVSSDNNWACTIPGCQYVGQSPRHMMRHAMTHSGERPFPCLFPGCGYRAKQREHLRTHELKHSDLKPFECPVCDFATKRKEHLKRHLKRHGGAEALREQ